MTELFLFDFEPKVPTSSFYNMTSSFTRVGARQVSGVSSIKNMGI